MQNVNATEQDAATDAVDLIMGSETDLHSIMIRSVMETTAVETTVELTNRVVSAYKK